MWSSSNRNNKYNLSNKIKEEMEYLDLGMVLATTSVPIVMYYLLTIESVFNDELTRWWNGQSYRGADIVVEIIASIAICFLTFVLTLLAYPVITAAAILAKVVISLRNKRLSKINKRNDVDNK